MTIRHHYMSRIKSDDLEFWAVSRILCHIASISSKYRWKVFRRDLCVFNDMIIESNSTKFCAVSWTFKCRECFGKRLYFSGEFEDRSRQHQSKPRQFPTRDVATSDIFRDVSSSRKLNGRVVRNDTSERAISTQPTSILHVCTFLAIRKHTYRFDW